MGALERLEKPGIRGWLHQPAKVKAAMLLSHGAGGDGQAPLMVAVAKAFCDAGYLVLRWDLPFRQAGPRSAPGGSGQRDRDGIRNAAEFMRQQAQGVPLCLAGQSYGGRQSSMVAVTFSGLCSQPQMPGRSNRSGFAIYATFDRIPWYRLATFKPLANAFGTRRYWPGG